MKTSIRTSNNLNTYLVIGFGWNGLSDYQKEKTTKKSNN